MDRAFHVVVLGAGMAGLSAAYDLGRAGCRVTLLETRSDPGGLASSIMIEGHPVERFYHFICRGDHDIVNLAREVGIEHQLQWRATHTSNFYNGRRYPFSTPFDLINFSPVPLWQRIRFGIHILESRFRKNWQHLDKLSASTWLRENLGGEAYDVIWKPLLQVKFAEYHEQISAAWMWHRIMRVARSRKSLLSGESFGYFENGSFTLVSALMHALENMPNVTIKMNSRAAAVETAGGAVSLVKTAGGDLPCDAVISTLALEQLADLLPDYESPYKKSLRSIPMIGIICMVMSLKEPFSRDFWLNINDPRIPHNGVIEITNLNKHWRQAGLSILYIPYYVPITAPRFGFTDQALFDENLETLRLINPSFTPDQIKEWHVSRLPYAQAICTTGYLDRIPATRSPIKGLFLSDSTQFYPEDRTLSAAIRFGRRAALQLIEDCQGA